MLSAPNNFLVLLRSASFRHVLPAFEHVSRDVCLTRERALEFAAPAQVFRVISCQLSVGEEGPSDLMKLTSCHRCGSGNLDQTGMPQRTTPFVTIQKIAPGAAF